MGGTPVPAGISHDRRIGRLQPDEREREGESVETSALV